MGITVRITIVLLIFAGIASHATSATLTSIHNFSAGNDGSNPYGGVIVGPGGVLYGTTHNGGSPPVGEYPCFYPLPQGGCGTVFSLTPPAVSGGVWTETVWALPRHEWAQPTSGVILSPNGALYGVASSVVFELYPSATRGITAIASGLPIIQKPQAPLVLGAGGVLYGTSWGGGTAYDTAGDVFSVTPPTTGQGALTVTPLYIFGACCAPVFQPKGIVVGTGGVLYGTTSYGGAYGDGIVYSLTPPTSSGGSWSFATLYNFAGATDGANPYAGLVIGANGILYGTTQNGGASHNGTVFSLTPPSVSGGVWTEAVLYSFTGGSGGANPVADLTIGRGGVLFGTTEYGDASNDGTVFSLTPPASNGGQWSLIVLHSFTGPDGANPLAGVVFGSGGALYGTTSNGGTGTACSKGCGTVFEIR
jgi:uncharacterized repeat protein (TIGR03803 family)